MTETGIKIKNVVIGDSFKVERFYGINVPMPLGVTVTKAYLTCKQSDSQLDAAALFQRTITTSANAHGQITKAATTGSSTVTAADGTSVSCPAGSLALYFDVLSAQTVNAIEGDYEMDIQLIMSDGQIHTMEKMVICFIAGVTTATS